MITWRRVVAETEEAPYRGKNKPESRKQANRAHGRLRAPGERANAQLKTQCRLAYFDREGAWSLRGGAAETPLALTWLLVPGR
jgi:hypothetical protein